MKIQELRLGNYVYDDEDVVVQVRMLLDQSYKDYDVGDPVLFSKEGDSKTLYYSDIKAIPLTVKWFKKCGGKNGGEKLLFISMPKIKAELHFEIKPYGNVVVLKSDFGEFIPDDIEYVHQLQNLFFCLSGEELTIKEVQK